MAQSRKSPGFPLRPACGFFLIILTALALYFFLLRFAPDAFSRWPFQSHYAFQNKHIFSHGLAAVLPLLATGGLLLALATRMRRPRRWLAPGLFVAALALQWSLSFLDSGLSARRLSSTLLDPRYGHSEFAVLAFTERSPLEQTRQYEYHCLLDRRFLYAQTKPPGQLLVYTLAAHAWRALPPGPFEALARRLDFYPRGPLTGFGVFATILFSVISCLPVFVLAALGGAAGGRHLGLYAALVFSLCPAVMLVTMHLDQVLYPLLVAVALLCAVRATRGSPAWGLAAGLTVSLACYVSFSLIFLIPMVLLIWFCHGLARPGLRRRLVLSCLLFALGLLAGWALLRLTLAFNLPVAWRRSMLRHIQWRHTAGLLGFKDNVRNFVEFAIWLGLPASLLYTRSLCRSTKKITGLMAPQGPIRPVPSRLGPWGLFALFYPLLLLAVSVFGHTTAEIARLWIPLMIPMLIPVARELLALERRPRLYVIFALAMLLLVKNYHDFS